MLLLSNWFAQVIWMALWFIIHNFRWFILQSSQFLSVDGVGNFSMGNGVGLDWVGSGSVSLMDGVVGYTFVFDISDVSVFMISMVGHNLGTTVGEGNPVFTGYNAVFVLGLLFVKIGAGVFVTDSVSVGERTGWDFVASMVGSWVGGWVVWGWWAGREGEGGGHEGGCEDEL